MLLSPSFPIVLESRSVMGILVLEILVRGTNIFTGKYGPPREKSVQVVKTLILGHLSATGEYKTTLNQRRIRLGNSQRTWGSLKQN